MSIEISVIVPTYNRREGIKNCLNSLFSQDYPKEKYEIIVVDDGSNYNINEVIDQFKKINDNLRFFCQCRKGPACARNLGAKAARGEIISFVDDDCVVSKDWVSLMIERHLKNDQITAVGGLTLVPSKKSTVLVSQFLSNCSIKTYFNQKWEVIFFPTCNVSLKKWVFDKYSFDEKFPLPGGEDLEFFWRIFKDGHRFIWDESIKVMHYRDDATLSFLKQAYIYGRGNLLVQHLHKDQPLLKELKTGNILFWFSTLVNVAKIPRFSYLLGKKLIVESDINNFTKKISIYAYFAIHKVFYVGGNIVEYFRIKSKKISRSQYKTPKLLIMDITHSCNLHCRICDIWKTAKSEENIGTEHIKKILFQAKQLKIKEIAFSGGESLLRSDIFQLIDYCRMLKIKNLGILSNGILVGELIDRLKPYLLDNTISLVISLDSLNPYVHNYIRNSNLAWERTVDGLKSLSSLKKQFTQVNFNAITIVLKENLKELLDIAIFLKSLGVNSLQFQPLLSNNLNMAERKKSEFWINEGLFNELEEAIDKLIDFKEKNPEFIKNSSNNLSLMKRYYRGDVGLHGVKCFSGDKTVLISNRGEATTCFSCYGDVKNEDLKDILSGKRIVQARERVNSCSWPCLLPCFCDL